MNLFREFLIVLLFNMATPYSWHNQDSYYCIRSFCTVALGDTRDCQKNISFLSSDPKTQQKAFTTGKTCFFDTIKSICDKPIIENISKNYDKYLETITKKPENVSDCFDPHYLFAQCRWRQSGRDAYLLLKNYKNSTKKFEAKDVANISKVCQGFKNSTYSCSPHDSSTRMVEDECDVIDLKQTPFIACLSKIRANKEALPKYKCVNFDFQTKKVSTLMQMFTTKKWCNKWIMKKHCGKSSVADFKKHAALFVKTLNSTLSYFTGYNPI